MSDPTEPIDPADRELRALLRTLSDDLPDGGFSAQLHMRLVHAAAARKRGVLERLRDGLRARPLLAGALSGACSGIAAFAILATFAGSRPNAAPSSALTPKAASLPSKAPACEPSAVAQASAEVFVVPEGKVALVQLDFAVDHDVETAEFSVLLPEGLAFFSDGEALPDRSFRWSAGLGKGNNRIPIAVVGTRPGRHQFTATATIAGEVVVHEVVLDVRERV